MSIFRKIGRLFKSAEPAADRVVGALKKTELGDMVVDSINAVASKELTGSEKFEVVVGEVLPRVTRYLGEKGGIDAAESDLEDLARALVQSVYTEVKSVGFKKLLPKLVKLLGL